MLMPQYSVYQCLTVSFSPSGSSCFRFSPCDLGFSQHGCLKCSWLTQQLASKTVCSKRDREKMPVQLQSGFRTDTVLLPCIPLFRIIRFKEVEKKGLLWLRGMAWAQSIWLCRIEDAILPFWKMSKSSKKQWSRQILYDQCIWKTTHLDWSVGRDRWRDSKFRCQNKTLLYQLSLPLFWSFIKWGNVSIWKYVHFCLW